MAYRQVSGASWERVARAPWKTASEMTRAWNRVVDSIGLEGTIPYALRHTSIVRGIKANLPIRPVAALHDTSAVMIERHYSRWITEGLEESTKGGGLRFSIARRVAQATGLNSTLKVSFTSLLTAGTP